MPPASTTPETAVSSPTARTGRRSGPTGRGRSVEQHRRFFGLIKAAFDQWPEGHDFQPDSAEHLRAWLLCKAGHRVVSQFDLSDDASEVAKLVPVIAASMLRSYCWAWGRGVTLNVMAPRSIAFDRLPHIEACKLFDDVADVISAETGLDPEALLRERSA